MSTSRSIASIDSTLAAQRRRYHDKQAHIREFKSERGCRDCGIEDVRVLQLHHRDVEEKNPRLRGWTRNFARLSWADLEIELKKCDVLCANCHLIETWYQEDE